jgi:hypothetical protein
MLGTCASLYDPAVRLSVARTRFTNRGHGERLPNYLYYYFAKETHRMRSFTTAICTAIAIGLLAGCTGNTASNGTSPLGLNPQVEPLP